MLVVLAVIAGHAVLLLFAMKTRVEVSVYYSGSKSLDHDNKVSPKC